MRLRRQTIDFRRLRWSRALRAALFCVFAIGLAGCQKILSRMIVYAPNHGWRPSPARFATALSPPGRLTAFELRVSVGPPDAELAVRIIDPPAADPSMVDSPQVSAWGRDSSPPPSPTLAPRGTILILHGIYACKEHMRPVADLLANAGYRAILVDLRGHGRSTGDWLTYGVVESRDLSQLLSALEEKSLIAGPVGVYGASYGGGVAIQLAGCDPRVRAVVTVAAFSSLRDVVPPAAKFTVPGAHLLSDEYVRQTLAAAGNLAQFDPAEADGLAAMGKSNAPVLLFHGDHDAKIPCEQSRKLAEAAGPRARYVELREENHTSIMWDRQRIIASQMLEWFDRYLANP